jgi:NAD(P)-dependent dehydrogenase (short-subunit alcohol dehydrogenase family)
MSMTDIIITGSTGLIGSALTSHYSNLGHRVFPLDISLGNDLTNEREVKALFKALPASILINTFAYNPQVSLSAALPLDSYNFRTIHLEQMRDSMEVNVIALFSVCREFIISRAKGIIVNFSSIYGIVAPQKVLYDDGLEKPIDYGITKAATISLTKQLAVLAAPDFRINCIAPGGILNDQGESFISRYSTASPIGRMMNPEEIVAAVDFLISDSNTYTTGIVLPVDGGWTSI